MKIYIVHGSHYAVPGVPTSLHFDKPAADAAALALVNLLRADISALAADDGCEPLEPIHNPEEWPAALREAQALRIHTADGLDGEPDGLDIYSEEEIEEAAECGVWIEEHEAATPPPLARIAARIRGEWFDPLGDLESDIAGVLREAGAL